MHYIRLGGGCVVKHKVFSILLAIILCCVFVVPLRAESTHPIEPYMPTPIYSNKGPASAVFINFYIPSSDTFYCRYFYSTTLNNNLVYVDSTTPFKLRFEKGNYYGFTFSRSDSLWVYNGEYTSNPNIFDKASMDWILENAYIYSNVDIVDEDGNILFGRNSQIIDGVLVPNDYTGEIEEPEIPDYDSWYERIFGGITEWFGGVLEVLKTPFEAIAEGLSGVWQAVDTIKEDLKSLFIPSVNILPLIIGKFADKFPIINQVGNLFATLYNPGTNEPVFTITYKGMTLKIIDFTVFSDYMPLIRNFTGVFLLLSFLTKEVKRLPRLLRGRD